MIEKLESQLKEIVGPIPIRGVSQGAEALVYVTDVHPYMPAEPAASENLYIIKYRPPKPYRHPSLDAQLTKHRTLSEARILQKLLQLDVPAPSLVFVDPRNGLIWMEHVKGLSLKQWIWDVEEDSDMQDTMKRTLTLAGAAIARLHLADIVHGDLTSSNIMLQDRAPVLIDFGLASQSSMAEDKAVDLYVLERAIQSTHPIHSEKYNGWLLDGYLEQYGKANSKRQELVRRLEQVRLRGRKRSMVG